MLLVTLHRRLKCKLLRAENTFRDAVVLTAVKDRHIRRHKIEGALSDAWQAYCEFVRELCIASASGCTTELGTITIASMNPNTPERAAYVAKMASQKKPLIAGITLVEKRKEPTWGDVSKIGDIISALNPTNSATLMTHLLGNTRGPNHCQLVRNACSHKHNQNLQEVKNLAVQYIAHNIWIPSEATTWLDVQSKQPAFVSWLNDMRSNAEHAIK